MPVVMSRRNVTVTVQDGTGTPITATLTPGPGDLKWSGLEAAGAEAIGVYNRGAFLQQIKGDDKQITGSITIYEYGDQTGTSVLDAVRKTGNFASGVTVDPGGQVWALDMIAAVTDGSVTNTYTFSTCRFTADYQESKDGNTWTLSFTCYEGVAVT
jgi:hypothetical protein